MFERWLDATEEKKRQREMEAQKQREYEEFFAKMPRNMPLFHGPATAEFQPWFDNANSPQFVENEVR